LASAKGEHVKIEFEGRTREVDVDELSLTQAVVITGRMAGSLKEWEKSLEDPDSPGWLDAMRCLYWLMVQQDGEQAAIGDVDFPVLKYAQAVADAIERESAPPPDETPEDPTRGGGQPAAAESPTVTAATG
jgi:hypothetical protein